MRFYGHLIVCLLAFACSLHGASFTTSLDRDTISVGEQATLTLAFDSPASGFPELPAIPGVTVRPGASSSQTTIINGQVNNQYLYTYGISAAAPGTYVIPQMTASLNGVRVSSKPLTLRVVPSNQPAGTPAFAFLKLIVPKTNVYVGEVIPIETPFYLINGKVTQFPQVKGDGFVLGKQPQPAQNRTQIGNNIYHVFNFRQAVSAAKIGELTLGPAEIDSILYIQNRRSRGGFFDDIFDGFGAEQRRATLTSEPQVLHVLPLPRENVPASFNGAIGAFEFSVSAGPTNLSVGDPITVRYVVRGHGNLDAVALPALDWREFKTYAPSVTLTNTDTLGIEGVKTFEQVVIPQNAEIKSLPDISFSFFDPDQKTYRVIRGATIPLSVKPPSAAQAQPTVVATPGKTEEPPQAARDIVHIKNQLGVLTPRQPVWARAPGFIVLQTLPVLAWLGAVAYRRRKEHLARNPRLQRKIAVQATIRKGLVELSKQAEAKEVEKFFSTLFRLLQEQIGERLDLPASAITEAAVEERPEFTKLPPETVQLVRELFQACNLARYAPQATVGELQTLREKAGRALEALRTIA